MWKVAAIAYLPVSAVLFGIMALALAWSPVRFEYSDGAFLYFGAAGLSFILAVPVSWFVARRMLTRREKRLYDAGVGAGR